MSRRPPARTCPGSGLATLYDIEADGRLAFRSTLPIDTRGESMFWCGIVRHRGGDRHGLTTPVRTRATAIV